MVLRWYLFLFSRPKVGIKVSGVLFLFGRSLNVTFVSSSFGDRRMVVWRAACCGCWTTLALILGGGWWGSGWASPSQTRSEYRTLWNTVTSSCALCSCCILSQCCTMHENTWVSVLYEPVYVQNHDSAVSNSKLGYWFEYDLHEEYWLLWLIQYDIVTLLLTSFLTHYYSE